MKPLSLPLAVTLTMALLTAPFAAVAATPRASGLLSTADTPALIATLRSPESSLGQKAVACQQLAIFGTPEAIPAVAELLDHPQLAVQARNVLENMPGPAAAAALRDALPRLRPPYLGGVVNTLGIRRDADAVPALAGLAQNPSSGVVAESLLALGRIASPQAIDAIRSMAERGTAEVKLLAAEGCVLAAEAVLARGDRTTATALFDVASVSGSGSPVRLAAQRGAILARGEGGIPRLLEQFRSPDPELQQLAARVARELPGAATGPALAEELAKSGPTVQILILGALTDRADSGLASAVEPLATSPNTEVRVAALEALGSLGGSSSVPVLLRALALAPESAHAAEIEAAANSLNRIEHADATILAALPKASAPVRARLSTILGYRNAPGATGALLTQAADPDPAVSKAAFDALAAVATLADLPKVIQVAVHRADSEVRDRAERSVYGICLKQNDAARRSEPLAKAFQETTSLTARASLLQIMAMLGDRAGSKAIASACEDASPETRDTALRLLVNWPDASPVPTLLSIFKTSANEVHRTLALRGIVTLSTLGSGEDGTSAKAARRPSAEAIRWLAEANAAVRNQVDEKKLILSGLGDLNCQEGLRLLEPYLDDASVRHDAELAALRAIRGMTTAEERTAAAPVLERIAASTSDADTRRQAKEALAAGAAKP
jgi:HEAT repeat protein